MKHLETQKDTVIIDRDFENYLDKTMNGLVKVGLDLSALNFMAGVHAAVQYLYEVEKVDLEDRSQ